MFQSRNPAITADSRLHHRSAIEGTASEIERNFRNLPILHSKIESPLKPKFQVEMQASKPEFKIALDTFLTAMSSDVVKYATHRIQLNLPILDAPVLAALFKEVQAIFKAEPVLLEVESPCIIVGDLHGQMLDLMRILTTFGLPSRQRYVFLGDLVDRGEFSIETLVIVLLLKVLWPTNVFLIRGNHEFGFLCAQFGYMMQMFEAFGDLILYQASVQMFGYIPFAARIDHVILCVHGGIGPQLTNIKVISTIFRPVDNFGEEPVDSLVWSDPADEVDEFEASSSRGTGYLFGTTAARRFMADSGLKVIIRGHECVNDGYKWHFENEVLTVFSASNYCGIVGNQAAVLEVVSSSELKPHQFPPLQWLFRKDVTFRSASNSLAAPRSGASKGCLKISSSASKLRSQQVASSCRSPAGLPRLSESPLAPQEAPGESQEAPASSSMLLPPVQFSSRRRKSTA
jgi:protein phosphatase